MGIFRKGMIMFLRMRACWCLTTGAVDGYPLHLFQVDRDSKSSQEWLMLTSGRYVIHWVFDLSVELGMDMHLS